MATRRKDLFWYRLLFLCAISMVASKESRRNIGRLHPGTGSPLLSRETATQLREAFDYICDSSGFRRFSLSIVSTDVRADISQLISRRASERAFKTYQAELRHFLKNCTWKKEPDLTWIFLVNDPESLRAIVRQKDDLWKSRSQYVIVYTGRESATIAWEEIFRSLWENYNVYRVTVASIRDNFDRLIGYSPFEFSEGSLGSVFELRLPKSGESNSSKRTLRLYDDLENLRGYELKVLVFSSLTMEIRIKDGKRRFSKLDADIMRSLERGMKARFKVEVLGGSNRSFGIDPFDEALKRLEGPDRSAEIILTSFFAKPYERHDRFEFTAGTFEDAVCLIAPDSGLLPKFYMPILPFNRDLWILVVLSNLAVAILWLGVGRPGRSRPHPLGEPRELAWGVEVLVLSCYPLTGADSAPQRIFLLGTLFFGTILGNLYQSGLVSGLSEPLHYPQLESLEDAANSNLTIVTKYENLMKGTFDGETALRRKLRENSRLIAKSTLPTLDLVAYRNVIALGRHSSFELEDLSAYYDEEGNRLLHVVPECPATYSLCYAVRLCSPYLERIDELLLRMQEAGLVGLWYEDMLRTVRRQKLRRKAMRRGKRRKLTLRHYSLTFAGLGLGSLASVLLFLVEVYHAKRIDSKSKIPPKGPSKSTIKRNH